MKQKQKKQKQKQQKQKQQKHQQKQKQQQQHRKLFDLMEISSFHSFSKLSFSNKYDIVINMFS